MIKIIKPGNLNFVKTCDKCGCVFEYEIIDINNGFIKCPTCSKDLVAITGVGDTPIDLVTPKVSYCETCDFYKSLLNTGLYVGDVPCQWCWHNPYKLYCDTACGNAQSSTPIISGNPSALADDGLAVCEVGKGKPCGCDPRCESCKNKTYYNRPIFFY